MKEMKSEKERYLEVLAEALNQIKYLHEKFSETGSGNNVINKIQILLDKSERKVVRGTVLSGSSGAVEIGLTVIYNVYDTDCAVVYLDGTRFGHINQGDIDKFMREMTKLYESYML